MSNLAAFALIIVTLATRAAFDKLLALSPDWTLVAHWAQAQSLIDLTAAVSTTGVGQGLAVFAARKEIDANNLMRDALAWSFVISGVAAAILLGAAPALNALAGREVAPAGVLAALAILGGLLTTAPLLFSCLWQGRRERGRMLALMIAGWAPMALGAAGLFGAPDIRRLLWLQIATQAALTAVLVAPLLREKLANVTATARVSPLRRYIVAGLSIGLMSPASAMWSRAELAHQLSWDEVAQLQALWRASEWVNGIAGGFLGLVFLPRMAAAANRGEFFAQLTFALRALCLPAALIYLAFWAAQGWIMPFLYTDKFLMPAAASALFLLGDTLRLASWVPLHGLFATERTWAIAVGEFLSLPLFALLLTVLPQASLVTAGACYAAAYLVYLAFNMWSVHRLPGRYAGA
jgi:O-antigen/teichoic acid export membrane protein